MTLYKDCNSFANFCKYFFATLFWQTLRVIEILIPSVIPFWKRLLTLYKDRNSFTIFCNFLQPYFAKKYIISVLYCYTILKPFEENAQR